jgi:hypothetical protein
MGLDSECDVMIDAHLEANRGARLEIAALRCDLMAEHLGVQAGDVARTLDETRSLIETVERLRGDGRSLRPYLPQDYSGFAEGVAKSEIADPESADDPFEPMAQHRLLRGLRGLRGLRRRR